jgi:flavin reductase ActVB
VTVSSWSGSSASFGTPEQADERAEDLAVALDGTVFGLGGYVEVGDSLATPATATHAAPDELRVAMAHLASGVVMVTTEVKGRPWGLTVSACCSVSLDPPLVLVSLNRRTQSWRSVLVNKRFGVSILRADQLRLAQIGAATGAAKFVDEFCDQDPDVPGPVAIRGALYHLDCIVQDSYTAGTHAIVVGRVRRTYPMSSDGEPKPLLYFNRTFHGLGDQL